MKTTGVVRRIDDLGRIVIPKEIRRTLRIRDGESLEIFLDKDAIALKKYSKLDNLEEIAKLFSDSVYSSLNQNILITDRDKIIATSSPLRKAYLNKNISSFLEEKIKERINIKEDDIVDVEIIDDEVEKTSYVLYTIVADGDSIGSVIILNNEKGVGDLEEALAGLVAKVLAKHIEE